MQKHVYSANIIRFNLLLRYIFNQICKVLQEDSPLPSKYLLRKLSELYDNNEGGELYKGLLSFMLEESIICIAKSILETKI